MGRYCIFSANYLPNVGGIEQYTKNLASELVRQGHKVFVVTNNVFNLAAHEVDDCGVEIVRIPCIPLFAGRLPVPKKVTKAISVINTIVGDSALSGVVINTRFYPHTFLGVHFAEGRGVRPIVIDHGSAYLTFGNKVTDPVVVIYEHLVTFFLKRHSVDFYGVSKKSVEWLKTFRIEAKGILSNSIDADAFCSQSSGRPFRKELGLTSDDFLVVFTGRLIPEKGINQLLEAMRLVCEKKIHLAIAGDGVLRADVEAVECEGRVHYVGRLDLPDISALYQVGDVLCLPTRSEGFATTLLEASAWGLPALITDVGGVFELIPNDSYGNILPSDEAEVIARALDRLALSREPLFSQGGRVSCRVRELFSWKSAAEGVVGACRKADRR